MEFQHCEQPSGDSISRTRPLIEGAAGYNAHSKSTTNALCPIPSRERVAIRVLTLANLAIVKEHELYISPLKTTRVEIYFQDQNYTSIARVPEMTVDEWYCLLLQGRPSSEKMKKLIFEWEEEGRTRRRVLTGRNNAVQEVSTGFNGMRLGFGVWKRVVVQKV